MWLIYSRKSVGSRIGTWGTPTLPGYSIFPSRTTRIPLLLGKEEIRPNFWPEIPYNLDLWRRPAFQILSKALDMSGAKAQLAPELLKALAILSDRTMRRSTVDQEDLKPYWKSEKRSHFFTWSAVLLFPSFWKTLLTSKRRLTLKKTTNRAVVFSCRFFPNILK